MSNYLSSCDLVTLLCNTFGYTLEHLTIVEKQLLRLILSYYTTRSYTYKPISLTKAMLETENMIYQITSKYPRNKESVSLAIGILEGIDIDTAEGLIESITKLIKSESNEVSNLPIQTKSFNKDFGNHVIVRSQKLRDNSKQLQMRYRENRANSKQLKILYNDFSCRFEALKAHFA